MLYWEQDYLHKNVNALALMPSKRGQKITRLGRQLFNVLLHRAMQQGDSETYSANLNEIAENMGYERNDKTPIKDVLKELMTTLVEWQSPTGGEVETWEACTLIGPSRITKYKETSQTSVLILRWSFYKDIRDRLIIPARYSRISFDIANSLSTHAAMALYEICSRYVDNPSHKTARQPWRWWKPVLTGSVGNEAKAEYRFFKRDYINKAIAEINARSDITIEGPIEYKERDNKTIADIQFKVYRKHIDQSDKLVCDVEDLPVVGRAISLKLSQSDAQLLLNKYGATLLMRGLDELEARLAVSGEKAGAVVNRKKWLGSVLERLKSIQIVEPILKQDLKHQQQMWVDIWMKKKRGELLAEFNERTDTDKNEIIKQFEQQLESKPLIFKSYRAKGKDHPMIRQLFLEFLGSLMGGETWNKPIAEDLLMIAAENVVISKKRSTKLELRSGAELP